MKNKTYIGFRCDCGPQVACAPDGDMFRHLPTRCDLVALSKTGFDWAYRGRASQQLAVALLADHGLTRCQILDTYLEFACCVVARFDYQGWKMTSDEIEAALERLEKVSA